MRKQHPSVTQLRRMDRRRAARQLATERQTDAMILKVLKAALAKMPYGFASMLRESVAIAMLGALAAAARDRARATAQGCAR